MVSGESVTLTEAARMVHPGWEDELAGLSKDEWRYRMFDAPQNVVTSFKLHCLMQGFIAQFDFASGCFHIQVAKSP